MRIPVKFDIRLENELQGAARVLLFDAIEMVNMSSTSSSSEGPVFLGPKCLYIVFRRLFMFLPTSEISSRIAISLSYSYLSF